MLFCELDPELPVSPSGQGRAAVVNGVTDSAGKVLSPAEHTEMVLIPTTVQADLQYADPETTVSSAFYVMCAVY